MPCCDGTLRIGAADHAAQGRSVAFRYGSGSVSKAKREAAHAAAMARVHTLADGPLSPRYLNGFSFDLCCLATDAALSGGQARR